MIDLRCLWNVLSSSALVSMSAGISAVGMRFTFTIPWCFSSRILYTPIRAARRAWSSCPRWCGGTGCRRPSCRFPPRSARVHDVACLVDEAVDLGPLGGHLHVLGVREGWMREGMAARGCSGSARVPIATGFQAHTRPGERGSECDWMSDDWRSSHGRRVAESPSRLSAKHSFSGTPTTSNGTLRLRNSSPRAFQRYPTHVLTPTACHNQHFPCGPGSTCPEPEPCVEC